MTRRLLILVIFSFVGLTAFPQATPTNPSHLPTIFPASPEASDLGRFGEIPVNSSVGMARFSVPIYTINEHGFELPISLNYQHNGLVVDQIPGHLGMGWSLTAGGMVTRQVRGRPDEDAGGYIGPQMFGLDVKQYATGQLTQEEIATLNYGIVEGTLDSQPDKFMVNVGNISASFYFDENKNVVIKPYKPYDIELIDPNNLSLGFTVTDDSGVKYRFAEQETSSRIGQHYPEEISAYVGGHVSGWKLTRVTLTNGRQIFFSYDNYTHYQRVHSVSFREALTTGGCLSQTTYRERDYEINQKIIKEISFNGGKVVFSNALPLPGGNNNYKARLNNIEIRDFHGSVVNHFELDYNNDNNTRKLLTSVTLNQDSTNKYTFGYYGTPPENIPYNEQDFWGFHNGNTGGLINTASPNDLYGYRQPDFQLARAGALSSIQYPTKGTTEIEYEANTFDPEGHEIPYSCNTAFTNSSANAYASLNWNEQNGGSTGEVNTDTFTIDATHQYAFITMRVKRQSEPYDNTDGIPDGNIYGLAKAEITKDGTSSNYCADEDCASATTDGCNGVILEIGSNLPINGTPGEEVYTRRVKLTPGNYTIRTEVLYSQATPFDTGDILIASAQVSYFDPAVTPPTRSVETGGIRVSKIKSCPNNGSIDCITKEYVYETNEGVSLGSLFRKRNATSYTFFSSDQGSGTHCNFRIHSSSSNLPLAFYQGSHVFYSTVYEKTVNNAGNSLGYVERKYRFGSPGVSNFPFLAVDNREFMNGHLSSEKIFNNADELLGETTNQYDFTASSLNGVNGEVYSLNAGIVESSSGATSIPQEHRVYANSLTVFRNQWDKVWLTETVRKDWENGSLMETVTSNSYNNPQGHIKTREITGSNQITEKVESLYPYDLNTGVYADMVGDNMISSSVQVKTYEGNDLTSNVKTEYNSWFTDKYFPEFMKDAKGNDNLQSRLVYHKYDGYGNPLDMGRSSGMRIAYIWGYNNTLPIVKLENLTYGQIPPATITNIQNLSDADDDSCIDGTSCNESALRTALNALRTQFPNAMVTTYTYDPIVGPTSITDPRGYTTYYEYDSHNRLVYVKDSDGNIIERTDYNLKN